MINELVILSCRRGWLRALCLCTRLMVHTRHSTNYGMVKHQMPDFQTLHARLSNVKSACQWINKYILLIEFSINHQRWWLIVSVFIFKKLFLRLVY